MHWKSYALHVYKLKHGLYLLLLIAAEFKVFTALDR